MITELPDDYDVSKDAVIQNVPKPVKMDLSGQYSEAVGINKEERKRFKFIHLEDAKFPGFNDKETQAHLFKW